MCFLKALCTTPAESFTGAEYFLQNGKAFWEILLSTLVYSAILYQVPVEYTSDRLGSKSNMPLHNLYSATTPPSFIRLF